MDFAERKYGRVVRTRSERASFDPRPVHLRTVDPEMEQRRLVQLLGECTGVKSGLLDYSALFWQLLRYPNQYFNKTAPL